MIFKRIVKKIFSLMLVLLLVYVLVWSTLMVSAEKTKERIITIDKELVFLHSTTAEQYYRYSENRMLAEKESATKYVEDSKEPLYITLQKTAIMVYDVICKKIKQ
ncbi:MAG: hypothetical protein PHP62_05950 [Candidatus Moranbacteria bacterium]|nr:hypothetical protein [Candidatus Moranbacteria bacterium]